MCKYHTYTCPNEEEIGIHKCNRKSRIDKINEEVKGWKSSSKQQEYPPERTKTK